MDKYQLTQAKLAQLPIVNLDNMIVQRLLARIFAMTAKIIKETKMMVKSVVKTTVTLNR